MEINAFLFKDDVSSISGSGSDSDGEEESKVKDEAEDAEFNIENFLRRQPRVFLKSSDSQVFSLYRALLFNNKVDE